MTDIRIQGLKKVIENLSASPDVQARIHTVVMLYQAGLISEYEGRSLLGLPPDMIYSPSETAIGMNLLRPLEGQG